MHRIATLLAVTTATLLAVGTAWGGAVQFKGIDIATSFPAPGLSAACGTPVLVTITGTVNVTLVTDRSGAVVREVDTQPGSRFGFAAPATGKSFDFPNSLSLHTEYPDGTTPGATALVKLTGLIGHAPGVPADAGVIGGEAEVLFLTPEGIPVVEFTNVLTEHGNRADGVVEAICAALN